MSEYLLDLTTTEPLPSVRIDGTLYPLHIDVEYVELLRMRDMGQRIQQLSNAEAGRTEQEEAELRDLLRRQVRAVIRAPDEVLEKLNDLQRFRLVMAFNEQVTTRMGPTMVATATSSGSDGTLAAR